MINHDTSDGHVPVLMLSMNSSRRTSAAVPGARPPAMTLLSMAAMCSAMPGWDWNLRRGSTSLWSHLHLVSQPYTAVALVLLPNQLSPISQLPVNVAPQPLPPLSHSLCIKVSHFLCGNFRGWGKGWSLYICVWILVGIYLHFVDVLLHCLPHLFNPIASDGGYHHNLPQ